jgi:hypothetical protein
VSDEHLARVLTPEMLLKFTACLANRLMSDLRKTGCDGGSCETSRSYQRHHHNNESSGEVLTKLNC